MDCIHLVQGRDQRKAVVNMVTKPSASIKYWEFFSLIEQLLASQDGFSTMEFVSTVKCTINRIRKGLVCFYPFRQASVQLG